MRLLTTVLASLLCIVGVALVAGAGAGSSDENEHDHYDVCGHGDAAETLSVNSRVGVRTREEMLRMRADSSPFRIRIVYDDSIELHPNGTYIKETYVEPAKNFWMNALRIRYPLTSNIVKSRSCATSSWTTLDETGKTKTFCIGECANVSTCSGYVFPEKYLARCDKCTSRNLSTCTTSGEDGEGIPDADLVIFMLSANVSSCPAAAAYSSSCERESTYFRTMVSVINICPPQIFGGYDPYAMRGLLKHEIMHSLGMSSSSYAYYVNENGTRYAPTSNTTGLAITNPETGLPQWSDEIVITKELPWETPGGTYLMNRTMMVAPLVRDAVRKHFACDDLEGAELENQGGSGTRWSHLEKRIFGAENIGGVRTESQNVSVISLAIMESTGWYVANYSAAEIYYWGQGLGCDFVRKSCYAYVRDQRAANRDTAPFCDVMSRPPTSRGNWWHTTCDLTRNYPTECNLRYLTTLMDPEYRYFNDTVVNGLPTDDPRYYGGGVEYTDWCPYLRQQILPSPVVHHNRYRRCKDPTLQLPVELDPYLEKYAGASFCVRQASPFTSYVQNTDPARGNVTTTWGSGCYEITCGTNVTILVGTELLTCRREGESISFDVPSYSNVRMRGELVCPLCEHACPGRVCPMQSYKVSMLETNDRSKAMTDPPSLPSLPPTEIVVTKPPQYITVTEKVEVPVSVSDDAAVIALGVTTGVFAVGTATFGALYFMTKKAAKTVINPHQPDL